MFVVAPTVPKADVVSNSKSEKFIWLLSKVINNIRKTKVNIDIIDAGHTYIYYWITYL